MKIGYDRDADIIVKGFHVGDFVRLVADQGGDLGSGRAGDWRLVTEVDAAGRLTIRRAGYSPPRNATLVSLSLGGATPAGPAVRCQWPAESAASRTREPFRRALRRPMGPAGLTPGG
jgi:hypothetical protein